jgi:hypothetical protein
MLTLNWTTAGIGLGIATAIIVLVRKDHLHTRYSMWWLTAAAVVVLFGLFPRLSDWLAAFFGVSYPPTLVLTLALALLGLKTLFMDMDRSRHERDLRRLAQRLALFETEHHKKGDRD